MTRWFSIGGPCNPAMDVRKPEGRGIMRFCLTAALVVSFAAGAVGGPAAPVWKAPAPDARSVVVALADGDAIRVDTLAENLFRVRRGKRGADWTESGLNRYGILKADWPEVAFTRGDGGVRTKAAAVSVDPGTGVLHLVSRVSAADVDVDPRRSGKGFAVRFSLAKGERVYGLGDCSRDEIMRRGRRYDIWVRNNLCNIPVPVAYGRSGWGVLLNSTWRHAWDVGAKDPDAMTAEAAEGEIDFYLFVGRDYRELLDTYTRLSGRPALLPVWGYGLTFVANQNIDQFNVVNECLQFRDRDLPCDVYGLEPGWMEKFYDNSIYKEWNERRFYFPYWHPKGGLTWIAAMKRLGFKLSLWLCCDYDLFRYEEQCAAGLAKKSGRPVELPDDVSGAWEDDRINPKAGGKGAEPVKSRHRQSMYRLLNCPEDTVPDGMLPWFEHLKKFVDQGAQCFKLDGCNQFGEHPNRKWANGRSDEEMHNLYTDVYGKQMARGYEDHTGRRAMVYSAGGYAGVQQFVATWAGDTGGGEKPLASFLNLGISGHSNQSCDMSIFDMASLHFGFLQTWSQLSNWDYWYQPWLQEPERVAAYRGYVHLRYRLLPYLYTAAAEASRTGWPVMRALPFVYPDEPAYDEVRTTYFLGPDLLVSAFAKETVLPPGLWHEWRTDAAVKGPAKVPVVRDDTWGGGLYVRAGAVIPTWPVRQHVDAGYGDKVVFETWPTADGASELYEDDGISLDYRTGGFARTPLTLTAKGGAVVFTVGARNGAFKGMPSARRCSARFHAVGRPKAALLDGKPVTGAYDEAARTFTVDLGSIGASGARLELIP